ncbi:MAG: sigma-54-dependent Fis family transcriptional regulator [Candidatus Atribacteria bacterium]|nr:sigma-54-dependent Fis family transcriptional regulator [Candidatus Atribacteria bacterium]
MRKVLLVEEDALLREKIGNILREERYYVIAIRDRVLAMNCLEKEEIDVVLVREEILRENSLELLSFARQRFPDIVIIVMGSEENSFRIRELLTKGIYEYLSPPFTPSRILSVMRRAEERISLLEENKDLKRRMVHRFSFAGLTGVSEKMQRLFSFIIQVSQVKRPILLLGEQGTGKEMVARAIHQYAFTQKEPFFKILCGTMAHNFFRNGILVEEGKSQNLGEIQEGTFYFEDVHLLPYSQQTEMLEFLEEYRFGRKGGNLRVIASSEVPLEDEVARGAFRSDLYYFLSAVKIEIPPLRERKEDIPFLVDQFLREIAEESGREMVKITKEALKTLIDYDWPGNVIELRNTLEGMVILSESNILTVDDIPEHITKGFVREGVLEIKIGTPLEEVEKLLIRETLKFHRFNKTKTAQTLGISPRTLYRKMEQYEIEEESK